MMQEPKKQAADKANAVAAKRARMKDACPSFDEPFENEKQTRSQKQPPFNIPPSLQKEIVRERPQNKQKLTKDDKVAPHHTNDINILQRKKEEARPSSVASAPSHDKPHKKAEEPQGEKRTAKNEPPPIQHKTHSVRVIRKEPALPFKERPFVKKTIAFWKQYQKSLFISKRHFVPLLPLVISLLIIVFRILYQIAAPTGANIYTAVAAIYLAVLLPSCTFYLKRRPTIKNKLGLQKPTATHIPFLILSAITLFFGAAALTSLGAYFGITELRYHLYNFYQIPATTQIAGLFYSTLTFAVIPAVAEELLCRGIIFAEYQYLNSDDSSTVKKSNIFLAVVMSAFFSTILQFDPSRILVAMFCGMILGFVRLLTGSLFTCVILHFFYNMACLFYEHFFGIMGDQLSEFFILFFICAVFALVTLFFLCGSIEKIYRSNIERRVLQEEGIQYPSKAILKKELREVFTSPTIHFLLAVYLIFSLII